MGISGLVTVVMTAGASGAAGAGSFSGGIEGGVMVGDRWEEHRLHSCLIRFS